jgi:chromosome segregation ATPase
LASSTATKSLTKELREIEETYSTKLSLSKEENSELQELLDLEDTKARDSAERVVFLERELASLRQRLREREEDSSQCSSFVSGEFSQAYEHLHGQLERLWEERQSLAEKLEEERRRNSHINAFLLAEGLQPPPLPLVLSSNDQNDYF